MSTFSGLNIGLSSLYAQRRGLELTGHNVANANTEGYSRQRVQLQGAGGPISPALHSIYDGVGNGVDVRGDQRLRDAFLEARGAKERGKDAELRGERTILSRVEGILSEPSDAGIASQLSDFWAGWDDVANNPTDLAARGQLLERSRTLVSGLNDAMSRLDGQWTSSHEQMGVVVTEINKTAEAVALLNKAIVSATHAGTSANDLKDQRDLLVQKLGGLAGVTIQQGDHGSVDVLVGGRALVAGRHASTLALGASATPPNVSVVWSGAADTAPVSGDLGGLLSGVNHIIPRYQQGLAAVAARLAERVNAQHAVGFDQSGQQGRPDFFQQDSGGRLALGISSSSQIAASTADGGGAGDAGGGNALAMARLNSGTGGPDQLYRSLVVQLGVDSQTAIRRVDIQSTILGQLDAARESDAGVNIDEEMTNMLAYQRAYEGAARFISAVDQVLDTLINRTGRVGL